MTGVERETIAVETPKGRLAAYCVRPRGESRATVLFLHGRTFPSVPDFDLQVPRAGGSFSFMEFLARRGITTWCFDHRGFGASWKPREGTPFTAAVRAKDLLQVLPEVRRRSPAALTLAGLSLGCSALAHAMKRHPHLAQRVVLMGPARWAGFGTAEARRNLWQAWRKAGTAKSRYITADFAGLEKRLWDGEETRVDRRAFETFVQSAIDANPEGPRDKIVALISEVTPYAERPVFRVPVLAIRGSDDDLATEADMEAVRRFVDPSLLTVRTFAGRKHDLHLYKEHEDVFACIAEYALSGTLAGS